MYLDGMYSRLQSDEQCSDGPGAVLHAVCVLVCTGCLETEKNRQNTEADAAEIEEPLPVNIIKKKIIDANGVKLNLAPVSKEDAIRAAGELLVKQGCVEPSYVDAMLAREKLVSTYMGMGLAIPHGTTQAKGTVKKTGIVFTQYPDGVDFDGEKAQLVIGIAGIGDEHLELLSKICETLDDEDVLNKMKTTDDVEWILKTLS